MEEAVHHIANRKLFLHRGAYFLEGTVTPEYIDSLEDFQVRDSDVFVITYPKSGTVWTQHILSLIYHEEHRNNTGHIPTLDRVPWLEYNWTNVDYEQRPSPRLFSSHLPHYLAPKGMKNKKAKVIYVTRNPKDNMVSSYHFTHLMKKLYEIQDNIPDIGAFMEGYLTGIEDLTINVKSDFNSSQYESLLSIVRPQRQNDKEFVEFLNCPYLMKGILA